MKNKYKKKYYYLIFLIFVLFNWNCSNLLNYLSYNEVYQKEMEEWKLWLYGKANFIPNPVLHYIYDRNQNLIGEFSIITGSYLPLERCEKLKWLKISTIVSEDKDFYNHHGVSYKGIIRAFLNNLKTLSFSQGGGTITQQLARNLFTGKEKTIERKILETLLAWEIEKIFKKNEILCLYLNKVYIGNGRYGVEEASWFYFNKPPENLNIAEASLLVGLFPSPAKYDPLKKIDLALKKQEIILNKLVRENYITEEDKLKWINNFIKEYRIDINNKDSGRIGQYGASKYFRLNKAPTSNEYVKNFIEENIPQEILKKQSLKIYTTIDIISQENALKSLRDNVLKIRKNNEEIYKKFLNTDLSDGIQGVLVSIDIPTGFVRALVGGVEVYDTGILNYRVFKMKRQVGSSIKGFLYALALERGIYDINSSVVDEPINIHGYKPRNWYEGYLGEISLKKSIARSVNTVAVKTLQNIGVEYFRDELTQSLGLSFQEAHQRFPANLSIALGTIELTPLELTLLYAAILNQGFTITPVIIQKIITNEEGIVLYEDNTIQKDISIISYESSAKILELLKGVVDEEEDGTAGWIGKIRNNNPNLLPYDIAGKSGTTQIPSNIKKKYNNISGIRDSWFVGLIPTNVTTVWLGHDNGIPFNGQAVVVWFDYISKTFSEPIPQKFPEVRKNKIFPFFNNNDFE